MGVRIFGIAGSTNPAEDFRLAASGLIVPASALNSRTGVTSTPVLTGTGSLTCTIGAFSCMVDGTSNSLQGSYWATLDSAATVTITTGASQSRIDLISLQIRDNAYDGSTHEDGQILYTAGTPGSGVAPTAPANSISLFTVTVPALATTLNFTTAAAAVFPYTAAAGGIVPVRAASDKPAVVSGAQYRHRLDVTATATGPSPLESSTDGTTWTPVSSGDSAFGAWTNLTLTASFASFVQPRWRTAPGGKFEFQGCVSAVGTVAPGSTVWNGGPTPVVNRAVAINIDPGTDTSVGLYVNHSGSGSLSNSSAGGTYPNNTTFFLDGCWCSV